MPAATLGGIACCWGIPAPIKKRKKQGDGGEGKKSEAISLKWFLKQQADLRREVFGDWH